MNFFFFFFPQTAFEQFFQTDLKLAICEIQNSLQRRGERNDGWAEVGQFVSTSDYEERASVP